MFQFVHFCVFFDIYRVCIDHTSPLQTVLLIWIQNNARRNQKILPFVFADGPEQKFESDIKDSRPRVLATYSVLCSTVLYNY